YMPMGETGMGDMMEMGLPRNTLRMMSGNGPFGPIGMGGMFTVLKVREGITRYEDPGWYKHPEGTLARKGCASGSWELKPAAPGPATSFGSLACCCESSLPTIPARCPGDSGAWSTH